jgi:DNA-binding MarR family transcriptional regulator
VDGHVASRPGNLLNGGFRVIESEKEIPMERSKADSFTAFLEAKQRLKAKTEAATSTAQPGGNTPLSLLFKLADSSRPGMKLSDLEAESGMPFATFADTIKSLGDSGYLTVVGSPGNEIVTITALGQEVSRLARPA